MNEYKIIILRERPELAPIAAEWFHCKWGVPTEAYLECIGEKRLRQLAAENAGAEYIMEIGTQIRIKRPEFETYLSTAYVV